MRFRTANPVLRRVERDHAFTGGDTASYQGVIFKTALMLGLMVIAGVFTFTSVIRGDDMTPGVIGLVNAAPFIALISVIVASLSVRLSALFTTIYALCQGLFLGVVSAMYDLVYGDFLVATAILATVGVFTGMLGLYSSGLVRVTAAMRRFLFAALIGILIMSVILMIIGFASPGTLGGEGTLTLLLVISVVSIIVASLYLLVDFDNIVRVVDAGADKRYEWRLALGLMVTLVWLYVELLRLLALLRARRR